MTRQPGIVVLGGINMDLVTYAARFPGAGETVVGSRFLTYAGGKGANQAVAAARMGGRSRMVGRVGDDLFGPQLLEGLAAAGVDVSGVATAAGESSGIAVISVDEAAQNRIIQVLGANATCGPGDAARAIGAVRDAAALMLQLEAPLEVSLEAARAAFPAGKTVILDPGPVRPFPDEFYAVTSIITPNETEAEALVGFPVTGPDAAEEAARVLLDRGTGAAVVKLGSQGAVYADAAQSGRQPAFPVEAVDSVAAGDAFNGALAVCLAQGHDLAQAVRMGCAAGALAVTVIGAQDSMPSRRAVEELAGTGPVGDPGRLH